MKDSRISRRKIVILFFCFIVLMFTAIFVIRVRAQNDIISELNDRLVEQKVPVKSVVVQSRIPFQIEITIQPSAAKGISSDETWITHLAYREASLSHRYGLYLDAFILVFLNEKGEIIGWEQTFLYPEDPSRQPFPSDATKLNNEKTEELMMESLNFYGMTLDELNASTGAGSRDDVQTLVIRLSVQDIDTANKAIPGFMGSILSQLERINAESEASKIAILRIWVVDGTGQVLLKYIYDLEVGRHIIKVADGITADLYPQPPVIEVQTPTPIASEKENVTFTCLFDVYSRCACTGC